MTPEFLLTIVAAALALLFAYFPGLANWYQPLPADRKRWIMVGLLVLSALGSYGYECVGLGDIAGIACDTPSIWILVQMVFLAAAVNQGVYLLSPKVSYSSESYKAMKRSDPLWIQKYEAHEGQKAPRPGNPNAPWKDKTEAGGANPPPKKNWQNPKDK